MAAGMEKWQTEQKMEKVAEEDTVVDKDVEEEVVEVVEGVEMEASDKETFRTSVFCLVYLFLFV